MGIIITIFWVGLLAYWMYYYTYVKNYEPEPGINDDDDVLSDTENIYTEEKKVFLEGLMSIMDDYMEMHTNEREEDFDPEDFDRYLRYRMLKN